MKFRNVCVFFVKCVWRWILGRSDPSYLPQVAGSALGLRGRVEYSDASGVPHLPTRPGLRLVWGGIEYSDAQIPHIFPRWPGLRSVWACSLKLVLDKRLIWGRYEGSELGIQSWRGGVWGTLLADIYRSCWDGDFWLFDWRICLKMQELKCVTRCRRNVTWWHLWPTFRVDI